MSRENKSVRHVPVQRSDLATGTLALCARTNTAVLQSDTSVKYAGFKQNLQEKRRQSTPEPLIKAK